jgi:hypothetical protein
MDPGLQRSIECTQGGIIEIGEKIPKKAKVDLRTCREPELLFEGMPQFLLGEFRLLLTHEWFVEQVYEMQTAFELRKEIHGFGKRRTDFQYGKPAIDIQHPEQARNQLAGL